MNIDLRYQSIRSRLTKLSNAQIETYLNHPHPVVYDDVNYRAEDGSFCPLSIMLGIPEKLQQENIIPSQKIVREILEQSPYFGTVKGLPGEFYRENREEDLKGLCQEILEERKMGKFV